MPRLWLMAGKWMFLILTWVILITVPQGVGAMQGLEVAQVCTMLWTDASGKPRDNVLFPKEQIEAAGSTLWGTGFGVVPRNNVDLFYYDNGGPVPPGAVPSGADIQGLRIDLDGTRFSIEFFLDEAPSAFPLDFRTAFQFPSSGDTMCRWCAALRRLFEVTPVSAQTIFSGPDFRPDLLVQGLVDGPGRGQVVASGRGAVAGGQVEISGRRVRVSFPVAAAASVGLLRPGIRIISGLVTQLRVFDRVPDVGSFQIGVPGFTGLDARNVIAKFDIDGDGKDDVFYLDTNGNGLIDAAARDRNGDGQITFNAGEGPFQVLGRNNRAMEFTEAQRAVSGRRQILGVRNDQVVMLSFVEDKNGSGKIDAADELAGYLIPLR